ncbi:MAG: hypothetical protein WCJ40_15310 [Planctomycetota bacterium]|jgi:hypothetical protein|nr:hypothetical protein [Planctomycetota bacterium]RLT10342.1 MAG: hypothetical protein DWI24_08730 [Planctomycetota bacterium]
MKTSNRRRFVPTLGNLEGRNLMTTFEPIQPVSVIITAPIIGLPGPLPVPPTPPQMDKPLNPYLPSPLPAPTWIAV